LVPVERMNASATPARVLVVRLSALGDVLLVSPLLRAFADERPEIEVDVLTRMSSAPALAGNPHLRALHLSGAGGTRQALAGRRYDLVLDLSGTLRSRLLVLSLRRPARTIAKHSLARRLMVRRTSRPGRMLQAAVESIRGRRDAVEFTSESAPERHGAVESVPRPGHMTALPHAVERYFGTARGLVRTPSDPRPEIHLTPEERDQAARWLGPGAPVVALFPGARWGTKAWPAERFRELAERLARDAGVRALLFVGPQDDALAEALGGLRDTPAAGGGAGAGVHRLPFRLVAGVLEHAQAAVANDSAMMHLATATGTPLVAFFGPTVTGFGFRPLGPESTVLERSLPCRPCSIHGSVRCPLGHHDCLRGISIEEAFAQVIHKIRPSSKATIGGA